MKYLPIVLVLAALTLCFNSCMNSPKMQERARAAFVADSLQKAREQFIADSIERAQFVADSLEREAYFDQVRKSIVLTSYYISGANSVGGRDVVFQFKNTSSKTIKYLTFKVSFYNDVNDLVACDIRNRSSMNGKVTGPIKPNATNYNSYYWENAIYNYQAKRIILNEIKIEYTDGSELYIGPNALPYVKGFKGGVESLPQI